MIKFLKSSLIIIAALTVTSCAAQTNILNSLTNVKNSILKIETWASLSDCNRDVMTCPEDQIMSTGTGSVVLHNNKKHILTAAHICVQKNPSPSLKLDFYFKAVDQNSKKYLIKIAKYDMKADICLLYSDTELEPAFIPLSRRNLEYGEKVYNLSAPMGIIQEGMVPVFEGRYFGKYSGDAYYSIPAIGGASGSPIINSRGELVGMVHSVHYRFHHLTLSATYHRLWNFLNVEKVHIIQVRN